MSVHRVRLTGIQAEGRHGANPGERDAPQPFVVDLDAVVDVSGDSLDATADYAVLADVVRRTVADTSFELLESLAQAVADEVSAYAHVVQVVAAVHKPEAARALGLSDVVVEAVAEE